MQPSIPPTLATDVENTPSALLNFFYISVMVCRVPHKGEYCGEILYKDEMKLKKKSKVSRKIPVE